MYVKKIDSVLERFFGKDGIEEPKYHSTFMNINKNVYTQYTHIYIHISLFIRKIDEFF